MGMRERKTNGELSHVLVCVVLVGGGKAKGGIGEGRSAGCWISVVTTPGGLGLCVEGQCSDVPGAPQSCGDARFFLSGLQKVTA